MRTCQPPNVSISWSDSWQMSSRPRAIEQHFCRALRWPRKMTIPIPLMSSFAPGVRGPLGTSRGLNWENKNTSEKVYLTIIPRVRVGYEMVGASLAIIISYRTIASGIIVLLKTPTKYREFFPTFICKSNRFLAGFQFWADVYSYQLESMV